MHKLAKEASSTLLTGREDRFPLGNAIHVVGVLLLCAVLGVITVAWYL